MLQILKHVFGVNHKALRDISKALRYSRNNRIFLFSLCQSKLKRRYHIVLDKNVIIGNGLQLPHPQNIVIGVDTIIGNSCTIYHDVTFGKKNGGYPRIGNNVVVYPGAKLIGKIQIGDNSVIGANSVVLCDVPSNAIVAGVPARILRIKSDEELFK